jgi:hypothetical protein
MGAGIAGWYWWPISSKSSCRKSLTLIERHNRLQTGDRVHEGKKNVSPEDAQGWTSVLLERASRFIWELHCGSKDRTLKRGYPPRTLPKSIQVRVKNTGSRAHKRGRERPNYQAPCREHPQTSSAIENAPIHANHLEAFNASLRRRCAAYRRKTNTYAKKKKRLKPRLDVYWILHNFVRVHFTIQHVPALALGIIEQGLSLAEILSYPSCVWS